jgi:PAS domain S-box-containing protein
VIVDPYLPEMSRRVARRVPLAIAVFISCLAVSTLFEVLRFPERRLLMSGLAACFAALIAVTAIVARRRPTWTVVSLLVFVNVVGVAINAYHAVVGAPVAMCVWVLTALIATAAVILPWGRRNQVLASIGTLAFYPLQLEMGGGDALTWAAGGAYLLSVTGLSVFGAMLFARFLRKDVQLTATLSEREARLQSYFDLSLVGNAIVGADGTCREVNEELCRMLGVERGSLLGGPWWRWIDADEGHVAAGLLAQALAGAPARMDLRGLGRGGAPLHAVVAVRGLPGLDGRLDHALVLVHDITERRQAEIACEQSLTETESARRQAEAANRMKDALLATVSHELRTPLTPIMAWADLLQDGDLGGEERSRAIASIRRSARAQARLIDDLLDLSRIVAGEWRIDLRPVELGAVVHAALDVVRPVADAKGIRLVTMLPDAPLAVQGDAERLQQVVWNLVSNAIKFTPRDGMIGVTLEDAGTSVRLIVRDTGEGIAREFVPHVFEPFRQADASATRRHAGLGLGLAIVRALTERHGGTIRVHSDGEDQGATFTLELPALPADALQAVAAGDGTPEPRTMAGMGGPRASLRGVRVLVVDDEADSNAVVSALLGARGAEVRTALSAADALAIADVWRPDVVVSDIAMPGEDGIALLRALRSRRAAIGEVPAIALTAYGSGADRRRILAAGFQAYVAKPFDAVHLAAVVETAAASNASTV